MKKCNKNEGKGRSEKTTTFRIGVAEQVSLEKNRGLLNKEIFLDKNRKILAEKIYGERLCKNP